VSDVLLTAEERRGTKNNKIPSKNEEDLDGLTLSIEICIGKELANQHVLLSGDFVHQDWTRKILFQLPGTPWYCTLVDSSTGYSCSITHKMVKTCSSGPPPPATPPVHLKKKQQATPITSPKPRIEPASGVHEDQTVTSAQSGGSDRSDLSLDSQGNQCPGLPWHVTKQLLEDIESTGGIDCFKKSTDEQLVSKLCDARTDIYSVRGNKIRDQIRKKVYYLTTINKSRYVKVLNE
jgi:hypothetical protein